eukprot:s348_g16.t1
MESFAFVLVLECLGWPGALALAPTGRNWAAVLAEEIRRAARRRCVPLPASPTPGGLLRAFYRRTGLADLTNCRTASTMERYEEGIRVCVWGVSGRWADEAAAFLSRGTAAWDRLYPKRWNGSTPPRTGKSGGIPAATLPRGRQGMSCWSKVVSVLECNTEPHFWRQLILFFWFDRAQQQLQPFDLARASAKTAMGKGGRGKGQWSSNKGAYLENWAARGPKAVAFGDTYHVSLLRAYPGESGEMLVKRGGARQDMDLLKLSGIAERLSGQNSEALSRPEKWLSMLAACIRQAHRVLPYAEEDAARCGTPHLTASLSDTLLAAATLLDTTQKEKGDRSEVSAAVRLVLEHVSRPDLLAASLMVHRDKWTAELGKALEHLPQEVRDFVRAPDSDSALLEALLACLE